MKDYNIITADTLSALEHMVNKWLERGYIPVGGIAVANFSGKYLQAIALPEIITI